MFSKQKPKKLIVHGGHHKVATVWFRRIFESMESRFGWRYFEGAQADIPRDAQIFFQNHSQIDVNHLPPYVGSHVIRDPRDIVISGYFFHLTCQESWCLMPRPDFSGKSYQDMLQSLDQDDGIEFEMRHAAYHAYQEMIGWNYDNRNFIETKYEDLIENEHEGFYAIFSHYGFTEKQIRISLEIVKSVSFESITKRALGQIKDGTHLRSGKIGQWRDYFTDRHIQLCKELYGEGLKKLGYENDDL